MFPMLAALMAFLIGCLVLAVVIYVVKLLIDMLTLPDPVKQIALIIVGLLGLIFVLMLAYSVFQNSGAWWVH